jgi:hypothetical protein
VGQRAPWFFQRWRRVDCQAGQAKSGKNGRPCSGFYVGLPCEISITAFVFKLVSGFFNV